MAGSIYFICPDLPNPLGGVKVLYRQVDILNRNGFRAALVHRSIGFRCRWFANDTKVAYSRNIRPSSADILVFPEIMGPHISKLYPGMKKAIINQGPTNTFRGYPSDSTYVSDPYRHKDTIAVLVASEAGRRYLTYAFPGLRVQRFRLGIDPSLFSYTPYARKKRQICFMPRRHPEDLLQVIQMLRYRGKLRTFKLVPIQNKTEREAARIMKESLIFLSLGYPEGFSLPPAEAMACGCIVVGYHGIGGREYFKPQFCYPVEILDIPGYAKAVEHVLGLYRFSPRTLARKAQTAANFIQRQYSPEAEARSVVECWRRVTKPLL